MTDAIELMVIDNESNTASSNCGKSRMLLFLQRFTESFSCWMNTSPLVLENTQYTLQRALYAGMDVVLILSYKIAM